MRIRSRWWVLAVLSVLGSGSFAYGQRDPLAFASLGTLNVSSGTLNINTDTLTMSGAATFTGVAVNQNGGPQIAVFDFDSITTGLITINVTGTRALSLLSRGNAFVYTLNVVQPQFGPVYSTPGPGGYAGVTNNNPNYTPFQGSGPGGGNAFAAGGGGGLGGGFGGAGGGFNTTISGNSYVFAGGATYGNLFQTLEGGSGGGLFQAIYSGGGGGAVEIGAIGSVTVNSINTSAVSIGNGLSGAGAGGGILISGSSISFFNSSSNLVANGGSVTSTGTGGGGGRITLSGLSTYTLGTAVANTQVNGGTSTSLAGYSSGNAGVITIDALTTTVPSGKSITLTGNPITSIAGSTTQTGATVEAYVRKDLVINSGGTVTLGMDNALRRLDSSGNNITALTVNGTFNSNGYNQVVKTLFGNGAINLFGSSVLQLGDSSTLSPGTPSQYDGTLTGDGTVRLRAISSLQISNGTTLSGGFDVGESSALTIRPPAATEQIITSPITGAGSIAITGFGTAKLSGNNTFTGPLTVAATLKAGSNTAFGSNSAVTVSSGATLDLNGFNVALGSLAGSGSVQSFYDSVLTVGGNNQSTTFSGSLSNSDTTKVGTGSLTLSGFINTNLNIQDGLVMLAASQGSSNNTILTNNGRLALTVDGISTGRINGIGANSQIQVMANNTTLGSTNAFHGFVHQGILTVGSNSVTLNSQGFAQLGSLTGLTGGVINAPNGISLGSSSNLIGYGTINARVSAQLGSLIYAYIGNLSLGNSSSPAGFITAGDLRTNENTVTLNSSSRATLGSLTTLGNGGSPGTVAATNGVLVDFGNSLTGYGTINTPNNLIQRSIINGTVEGTSGAQPITFTGWVKGAGTFNNVVFAGTWDPGFSPTLITAGSLGFSSTTNLIMELGGMTRGSQFDGIDATGNVDLAGALSITRINGFNPNVADAFVLINRTGGTGTFAGLNEGDTFTGTDGGLYVISYQGMNYMTNMMAPGANGFSVVIAAVPEPTTWALIGLCVAGCSWAGYRRMRKGNAVLDSDVIIPE